MYFCCFAYYLSNNNFFKKLKNIELSINNNNNPEIEYFFLLSGVNKENQKHFFDLLKKNPVIKKKIIVLSSENDKKFLFNLAIENCNSKYIIFLSGNCYLLKDFYKNSDYLKKNSFDIVELSHNFCMDKKNYYCRKDLSFDISFENSIFLNEKIFENVSIFLFSKMFSVNFLKKYNLKFYYLKGSGLFYVLKTFRFAKKVFHWNKTKICYEINIMKFSYIEKRILIWHMIVQYINFLSSYKNVKTNLFYLFLLDLAFIYYLLIKDKITFKNKEKENLFLEVQKIVKNYFIDEELYIKNKYLVDFFNVIKNNSFEKQIEILKANNFSFFNN